MPTTIFAGGTWPFVPNRNIGISQAGITTQNAYVVRKVEGFQVSYVPGAAINGINDFEKGKVYNISAKEDIDLSQYQATMLDWKNVSDFKTSSNTWSTAFTLAIAAIASNGILYVPAGDYNMTGQPTVIINKPLYMMGAGGKSKATKISTTSLTQTIFDVDITGGTDLQSRIEASYGFKATDIFCKGAANATAGSAFKISFGYGFTMRDCFFEGFFDTVDVVKSYYWVINACELRDAKRWSLRIRDVGIPDGGDPCITDCSFGGTTGQLAMIRYESGGGLRMNSVKFNGNLLSYGVAFDMPFEGASVDLFFDNCSVENYTTTGFDLRLASTGTNSFQNISIKGVEFLQGPSAIPIKMTNMKNFVIVGNMFHCNGAAVAIALSNCNIGKIGPNTYDGVTAEYTLGGSTNIKKVSEVNA